MTYEQESYDLPGQPADWYRSLNGHYFAYETTPETCTYMWSTDLALCETLKIFKRLYGDPPALDGGNEATLLYGADRGVIWEGSTAQALMRMTNSPDTISFASLSFTADTPKIIWTGRHRPFDDIEFDSCEIAIISSGDKAAFDLAGQFARLSGSVELFDSVPCHAPVLENKQWHINRFGVMS